MASQYVNSWEDPAYLAAIKQSDMGNPANQINQASNSSSGFQVQSGTNPVYGAIAAPSDSPIYTQNQTQSIKRPTAPPAPAEPSLAPLQQQLKAARNKDAINKAMADYDNLSASTSAMGNQAANTAGAAYGSRLLQMGINPLASGVVAAQAKLPVYKQLADIGVQKEQTRLDYTNRADALAAQIAGNISQLQHGYTNMLADYNMKRAGYDMDLQKFNASQALESQKLAASLAASGGGSSSRAGAGAGGLTGADQAIFPGYIPNFGPITAARVGGREMPGQVIMPSAILNAGRPLAGYTNG